MRNQLTGIATAVSTLCLLLSASLFTNANAAEEPPRPNIVLILCDDSGFSDLGCYGGEIDTPNLDRLANEGLKFTQFYNCAVCVTTRASLMTGLHPRHPPKGRLHDNMTTLAEVLSTAGYHTSLTGKWHLGSSKPNRPTDRGFDEYYGVASGCCNFFDPSLPDPVFYNGGARRPFLHNEKPVSEFPDDFYATDAFTAHAIRQIEQSAAAKKPFFVHLCYTAPHFPLHAKPQDIAKYQGKYQMGYFQLREQRYQRQLQLGLIDPKWKLSPVDHRLGDFTYDYDITPWDEVENIAREERRMEVYAAMIDCLDQGVGRLLAALEKTGQADNTLVMFLSDNGGCASYPPYGNREVDAAHAAYNQSPVGGKDTYDFCAPGWGWAQCAPFRRFKVWTYEGGISTPFIARWPRVIQAGTQTDQVGHVVDFMPTLLELSGADYPATRSGKPVPATEGKSLLPIFRGQHRPGHDHVCWHLFGNRAIRKGDWKLVWGVTGKRWELYNMKTDRTETTDLSGQFPDRVAEMKQLWRDWADQTGVPLGDKDS